MNDFLSNQWENVKIIFIVNMKCMATFGGIKKRRISSVLKEVNC